MIKKILIGIFVCLMLSIGVSISQEQNTPNVVPPLEVPDVEPKLYWMSMPVMCGNQKNVEEYLKLREI